MPKKLGLVPLLTYGLVTDVTDVISKVHITCIKTPIEEHIIDFSNGLKIPQIHVLLSALLKSP